MVTIKVTRREEGKFPSRDDYLRVRGHFQNRKLCRVLGKAFRAPNGLVESQTDVDWRYFPWITPILGSGCADVPDDPSLHPQAFAAAVEAQVRDSLTDEIEELKNEFGGHGGPPNYSDSGRLVRRAQEFARDLVIDRAQWTREGLRQSPAGEVKLIPGAGRMVVLAAVLTEFYAAAKKDNPLPWSRWEYDRAFISVRDRTDASDLADAARFHADRARRESRAVEGPNVGLAGTICSWLGSVIDGLEGRSVIGRPGNHIQLTERDLRLATEIAWLFLTSQTQIYPGWTSLMTGLVLSHDRTNEHPPGHPGRVPNYFDLRSRGPAEDIVKLLSQEQLAQSAEQWSHPQEGLQSQPRRIGFYRAVANVLWSQASQSQRPAQHGQAPPATAFVSSFDLELEMALWRTAVDSNDAGGRDEYFVVVPVHVFAGGQDEFARPCWLRGRVAPSAHHGASGMLEAIRKPTDWRLIGSDGDASELRRGPHVVRLSGSPLTVLELNDQERERLVRDLKSADVDISLEEMELEHAVTLDEYLALRQAEAELVHQLTDPRDSDVQRDRSLPQMLVSNVPKPSEESTVAPRFWMAFGVPVADSAVRYRLISQISRRLQPSAGAPNDVSVGSAGDDCRDVDAGGGSSVDDEMGAIFGKVGAAGGATQERRANGAVAPRIEVSSNAGLHGVVVNRRIDDYAAHVLYWVGLDVVEGSVTDFIPDLDHYRHHLEAGGLRSFPAGDKSCEV